MTQFHTDTLVSDAKYRIVILDSEQLTLAGLSCLVGAVDGCQVIGNSETGQDGLTLVLESNPDLVLIDTNLDGYSPFFVAEEIRRNRPKTKILFFSRHFSDTVIERCLKIPCDGMILKTESTKTLEQAISTVRNGSVYYSAEIAARMEHNGQNDQTVRHEGGTPLSELTSRQLEVLHHLAKGNSVKEVAKIMHLSEKSIDSHKYRIMNRLGIHDRVKLSLYAVREGLIQP